MRTHNRLAAALATLGVVVVLALGGCASIPNSGPVKQGGAIAQGNQPLDLDFNPSPPSKGASQDDLLHGFIDAASSPRNGYAIAREYLTPRLASRWNPDASVTVDQGTGRSFVETAASTWQVGVTPQATVDNIGGYHQATSSAVVSLRYQFEKVGSEWRISLAPNGIVLDSSTFNSVFGPQNLYFFSPNFQYLVPDQRWFPARASTATRITKALLAGPSKWLGGAVVSAFPTGTQLRVDAVTTSNNQAQLDLTAEAGQADTLALERMKYQLTESLSTQVSSVQLSIEGTAQSINALPDADTPSMNQPVDSHPLVYRDSAFGLLTGSTVSQIPGISAKVAPLHPTAASLTANRESAAVLNTAGVYAVRADSDAATLVDDRPGLISPAIDNYGYIWTVPANAPGDLRVTGADGQPRDVKTNWPVATQISSLEVSRDGTRVIALIRTGDDWALVAAGIDRSTDEAPTGLAAPLVLSLDTKSPVSATWVDSLTVAVLGQGENGATSVDEQQIGGTLTTVAGPVAGESIVGSGGVVTYLVLTSTGSLQAPAGAGWQAQSEKVVLIGTQMGLP